MQLPAPSARLFSTLLSGNLPDLSSASHDDLRPFLPSLTRMAMVPTGPVSVGGVAPTIGWAGHGVGEERKTAIQMLIIGMGEVNAIRSYLQLNFQELRQDALKEQQLLRKLNPEDRGQSQSVLATSIQFGLAIEFERSNFLRRFRLFLSEILKVMSQLDSSGQFRLIQSDLFECDAHLEEICDIMCIATAELPSLLPVVQLSEALLWLHNGPQLLARVIANMPDCFDQVVTSLVLNGETLDEVSLAGRCRTNAIHMLCHMHPAKAAYVQTLAISNRKHPTLALTLALEEEDNRMRFRMSGMESERHVGPVLDPEWASGQAGVITLLHNIIIAGDDNTMAWFAQYLKCMQHKYRRHKHSAVTKLRAYILKKLHSFKYPSSTTTMLAPPMPLPLIKVSPQPETEQLMEATESSSVVIDAGHVIVAEQSDSASLDEAEGISSVPASSSSETLEDLIDQMDIELSDREGEGAEISSEVVASGGVAEEMGVESEDGEGSEVEKEVVTSEKIESSTMISTRGRVGEGEGQKDEGGASSGGRVEEDGGLSSGGRGMRVSESDGGMVIMGRRRKHSSTCESDFPEISLDRQLSNEDIVELMELLQVCCALKTQTQMYLKEEEAAAILRHIVCTCPPFSPAGVRFIEVTLCVMLACPFLISIDGCEVAVVRWFQWLLNKLPDFDKWCGGHCSYGELLLLISIHLREKQLEQIEELIANTLNMKVSSSLKSGHFASLSRLFLKVFTEEVVCSHAVGVPPTQQLSGDVKGYLPVHCIHQLIKMRNFRKYSISIKDWIYEQLLVVSEPLHPTLPPLLQEFVNSVLVSAITTPPRGSAYGPTGNLVAAASKNHTPFSAEEVLSVFKRDPETYKPCYPIPAQLLMLYYVLLYQDCYLTNLKPLLMQQSGGENPRAYGPKVLTQIPIKSLLDHARRFQSHYSTLYPTLLKLTAIQFPQLCLVCEWITEKREIGGGELEHCQLLRVSSKTMTPEAALKVLEHVHVSPSRAVLVLRHLSSFTPPTLVPYTHALLSTLPLLLHSPSVSRAAQSLYVTLWTMLNSIIPRRLLLETINALRPQEMLTMQPYTYQDIVEDPLIVLRCDTRVFRCPLLFDLILRCLAAYTSASKTWLHEQAHLQNCVAAARPEDFQSMNIVQLEQKVKLLTKQERDEMCIALSATQESALIQLLLEICLPTPEDKKLEGEFGPQLTPLREIRCLICSFLHHNFIDEPSLAKLVHFQGYPAELIPMMVSGIPSMHICLDFIPELLAQPRTERQVFGVQLAAHVIQQYPVPEAMGIAKDIFKRLTVLSAELSSELRESYFLAVLPSISLICRTFPPLCSEATQFLVHLSRVCRPVAGSLGPGLPSVGEWRGQGVAAGAGEDPLISAINNTFSELIVSITA